MRTVARGHEQLPGAHGLPARAALRRLEAVRDAAGSTTVEQVVEDGRRAVV